MVQQDSNVETQDVFTVNLPRSASTSQHQPVDIAAEQDMMSRAILRLLDTSLAGYRKEQDVPVEEVEELEEAEEMLDEDADKEAHL